ncbi:serine hydrolase [Synechococcus moorigangaii CMS01]|nr:serine hydrolase [Synechococcus moorigangaii CMS01]
MCIRDSPYIDLYEPEGADHQIRFPDPTQTQPIRNYLTTKSVARLLFDIERDEAVSPAYIGQVKRLLRRDLNPTARQDVPYNAIDMFLGEGLPPDTEFYSKMGWTFNNRNDAAIIKSPDGSHSYILVIFGDDKAFYEDKEFLPLISKFVYEQMSTVPPSELSRQN